MSAFKRIITNYRRYRRVRKAFAKVYYHRLFKATLLISIVPISAIFILVIYDRLTLTEGLLSSFILFFTSIFFAKPYLADLSSLTHYVEELAMDHRPETPPLSFLSNVEELSRSVKRLHASWGARKIQLESALAESSILFDILPDSVLMVDENLSIIRANKTALRTFGSHIGQQPLKHIVNDRTLIARVKKVIQTGKGCNIEINTVVDLIRLDFRTHIRKFPVYSSGGIAAVLVLHDITESKHTRQMMKDFVSNASHEIRTPLTSVIGFIEMMQTVAKDDKEAQQQFLDIMDQQAKQLATLINDLLSLSTAEMHEHTPVKQLLNVNEVISHAITSIQWQADEKHMPIRFKPKPSLPKIMGETTEIMRVIVNLLSNAAKYGYDTTPITIDTGLITQKGKKDRVFISVHNKGEAIPADDLPRLTERFYRIDTARSQNISGSGLGLSIVKHILNRHRGDMVIESLADKGTTVTIRLPLPTQKQILKSGH